MTPLICAITGKPLSQEQAVPLDQLRRPLLDFVRTIHPHVSEHGIISTEVYNQLRRQYMEELIRKETRELTHLEKYVLKSIHSDEVMAKQLKEEKGPPLTLGQKLADHIALFGGSWTFIIFFFLFILLWMLLNVLLLQATAFDPFPFILLNLILSCLAAIQAPIIMMSQNRQEQKDRQRSEYDYMVNLKAELEIRMLHEKVDHLIVHQIQRLIEIQQVQMDYLEEILQKK
jgi:uncharacterized membrane protein